MSVMRKGAALVLAATVWSGVADAAEVKLKAASFLPTRIIFAKYFGDWVNSVNKVCTGKVKISIVGPAAIKSLEQWNAVKTGVVDMHYGPSNYYKGVLPEVGVSDLATNELTDQRKNGAWKMFNDAHRQKMNTEYLTQIASGVRFYVYTNKPAKNGRFDGFRLRSVPIYDEFFKGLGANPVRMGPPAVYTALERKVIDGYGWPLWAVVGFGWHKYTKFRYGPGFFDAGINILVNQDKWRSLSGDQRGCLNERALWMEKVWPDWRAAQNQKEEAALQKAGVKYVDLGPNFTKKAYDLQWADLRKFNPAWVDRIRPLITK